MALIWCVVAIVYGWLAWYYGLREAMFSDTGERHYVTEVTIFAIGFGLVAAAALACAFGALLNRWYYSEYRMDKLWMIAALLATLSFPVPLLLPDSMKPRLGFANTFSWFGLSEVVQMLALCFLAAVLTVPLMKREKDGV